MIIRAATVEDLERLAPRLAALPLMQRYGRDADGLARDLREAHARGDGLLVDEAVTGLAWFLRGGTFALGGYLRLIAVVEAGQGTGKALLDAFERAVTGRHAFLLVSDFNDAAQRFYTRHGYAQVGALPSLVVAGVDELIFWKRLRTR